MAFSIFQDSEQEYKDWIKNNPNGYVLSTVRGISTNYMSLHRATCRMIKKYQSNMAEDAFTGQKYIKICSSDPSELSNWISTKGGAGFTKLCSKCNPVIRERLTDQARQLQVEFEAAIQKSADSTTEGRHERLKAAPKLPEKIIVKTIIYRRNPDVVAEVLAKAEGQCGKCRSKAPFNRASDGTPYLEVHHSLPLSEDGEDTVANAIALCPNCHRQSHYG